MLTSEGIGRGVEEVYYNKEESHVESTVEENGGIFRLVKLSLGSVGDFIFRGRGVNFEVENVIEFGAEIIEDVDAEESVTGSDY